MASKSRRAASMALNVFSGHYGDPWPLPEFQVVREVSPKFRNTSAI
jgi:hypothetical protein